MSPDLLIGLAWKSGLVAAAALLGSALLRRRPAAERVALLRLGVVMILVLPLAALLMPALRIQAPAFPSAVQRLAPVEAAAVAPAARPAPVPIARAAVTAQPPAPAAAPVAAAPERLVLKIDPVRAALLLYVAGAVLLLLRLLAGVSTLRRWTRGARTVADDGWLEALDRAARGGPRPALLASSSVSSPLSWGVRPAVILLNEAALPRADRADAVLAHEMGHVRRGDWLFLMLSHAVVAALWFNPLVWLLHRELARQSEQAADAWAVRHVGRVDYASALVAMAAQGRPHAALGIAGSKSELARRVAAVLADSARRGRPWPTALAAVACVGFATPLAAVELSPVAVPPALRTVLAPPVPAAPPPPPPLPPLPPMPTFASAPAPRDDDPAAAARLAAVLRQRDQGLEMMNAGARLMDARARDLRALAGSPVMDADDRAGLFSDAADLEREARELRAKARVLAARDPATLQPMSADEEREMAAGMDQLIASMGPIQVQAKSDVRVGAEGMVVSTPVQVSLPVNMQRPVAPPAPAAPPAPPASPEEWAEHEAEQQEAAREAAQEAAENAAEERRDAAQGMREGAQEIENGADEVERNIEHARDSGQRAEMRTQAAEMRRQAAELRRQADVRERGSP